MGNTPHVVIVGAGFGGLGVAEQLAHVPVNVTLIDRHNYHTFQPLLYQVATSLLNAEDVGAPVRSMFRHQDNVSFRMATVTGVDVPGHKINLEDGNQLTYDYLVLAGGATVNYFNTPGAAEHAFPLYTLMNAVTLRNRIMERFEAADRDPTLIEDGGVEFCHRRRRAHGCRDRGRALRPDLQSSPSRLPSARHRKGANNHCGDGERSARPVQREFACIR